MGGHESTIVGPCHQVHLIARISLNNLRFGGADLGVVVVAASWWYDRNASNWHNAHAHKYINT